MRPGVESSHKLMNALSAVIAYIACYLIGFCVTHSLTHSLHFCSRRGDVKAEEAAVLLQAVLLAAVARRCGKVISVQSLTLSDRLCRCLPRLRPPSTVPCLTVLERVSCIVTWPNLASFRCLTVARRGSRGPTRLLSKLRTQSLVLCSLCEMRRGFLRHLVSSAWILLSSSTSRVHVSHP